MRIGITFYANQPLLTSEVNQTAFILAELLFIFQHEVILIHQCPTILQYESAPSYCIISELSQASTLDWLIDIDGHLSTDERNKVAAKTIVFLRTFLQFEEMNASVYADYPYEPRNLNDVFEIWCWDILNPEETIPSIQTLFSCPIRRVPFIWSPVPSIMTTTVTTACDKDKPWIVHVSEENSNTSSIIIPMCAVRELVITYNIPATYQIHHADAVKENQFFKENVLDNLEGDLLPLTWKNEVNVETNSIVLSHSRFIAIRPSLLHWIWRGIPLVHNSPVIASIHPLLKKMYYTENHIQELCTAVTTFVEHPESWYDTQEEIRQALIKQFGIETSQSAWKNIIDSLPIKEAPVIPSSGMIVIAFANMWEGFNYNSNFMIDALRNELRNNVCVKGVSYSSHIQVSLVICGPHGQPISIPSHLPKVYWSAENWGPVKDSSYSLYLTNSLEEDDKHIRIPTWMMFIDWYTKATTIPTNCTDNPIRFPLSIAMQSHPVGFEERKDFCAFVVSNPTCMMRNETFHYVNNYKKVNSGGALYNNIGGQLALKYPGGGCGDVSKYSFFSTHQFTLSFENSQSPGYITEKVLHAKMAGCVPIYWGAQKTDMDFVPNSFINVSAISSAEKVVDVIKKLETRPDLCATIAATPIVDEVRKQKALDTMKKMSQKILALASKNVFPLQSTTIQGINQTFVVNLDSRPDRWDSLLTAEPILEKMVTRISAVQGKTLKMTRDIYQRYKNNPFQWKKAIIGCYMSHIAIWKKIVASQSSTEESNYFLVLEDDVRFEHGWIDQWNHALAQIPANAELLYLGGVLPPNKIPLTLVLDSVNDYWASIRPNIMCNPTPMPIFHFCTYSYIITKAGAKKLLEFIESLDGMPYPGCDHLLSRAGLQTYVSTPLLAKCAQEDDPAYIHSQFNDLHREDNFDSDIWNSNDCFTVNDVTPFFNETVLRLYYVNNENVEASPFQLYERSWLEDVFQCRIDCKPFSSLDAVEDDAWLLFQRPHCGTWATILKDTTRPFHLLHLSDEFRADDISLYQHPMCKGVIRNYLRTDVPVAPHIVTIPLGYHYCHPNQPLEMVNRKWQWSFHGTDWFERSQQLAAFQAYHPYSCRLQPGWNHPSGSNEEEYLDTLRNSQFCPILKGNNTETFRLYEALEAGVLPIFGPSISPDFIEWVKMYIDVSTVYDWNDIESINMAVETKEAACLEIMRQWSAWKEKIRMACQQVIQLQ
jgi:GR25 family glycosyltransferase involved in LPS biosynthesis